jgi:hypothetical protein
MKKLYSIILVLFCIISNTYAQIGIKANNSAPIPSAQLEVQSTTKAFYPPRMTTAQRNAIAGVAAGAIVFDTDLNGLFTYNGSSWVSASGLTLPYSVTQNVAGTLLNIENTNTVSSNAVRAVINSNEGAAIAGIANNLNPTGGSGSGDLIGVAGYSLSTNAKGYGVVGYHGGSGSGVYAISISGKGVFGVTGNGIGGYFQATNSGGYALITGTGNVGIGTNTPNAPLQLSNAVLNRKIVLYESVNNDHQFYGLGVNAGTFRYQVDGTGSSHIFYAATGATTSNELMRIRGDGNVGIGVNPSEKLDVSGNIKASGEINRTQTTDANLVPIAYGNIFTNGAINSVSTTTNVSVLKVSTGVYQVSIAGETYNANDYTTQVTLNNSTSFGFIVISSGAGVLNVYTANTAGTATDRSFTFVVYKK